MKVCLSLALVFAGRLCEAFHAAPPSPSATSRWARGRALQAATLEKNADGLEYVQLTHESGAKSQVYLFGGDVTQVGGCASDKQAGRQAGSRQQAAGSRQSINQPVS
jgi:hypothetical protein